MTTRPRSRLAALAVPGLLCLGALALTSCDGGKKAAPKPAEPAATDEGSTDIGPEMLDTVEKEFQKARDLAEQAASFAAQGEALETSQGPQAAKEKYKRAKRLFQEALGTMEDVLEPELNPDITEEQAERLRRKYDSYIAAWSKQNARIGKIAD